MECSPEAVLCDKRQPFIAVLVLGKSSCVSWWRLYWLGDAHLSVLQECLSWVLTVVYVCWSILHVRPVKAGSFSLRWGSGAIDTAGNPGGPLDGYTAVSSSMCPANYLSGLMTQTDLPRRELCRLLAMVSSGIQRWSFLNSQRGWERKSPGWDVFSSLRERLTPDLVWWHRQTDSPILGSSQGIFMSARAK